VLCSRLNLRGFIAYEMDLLNDSNISDAVRNVIIAYVNPKLQTSADRVLEVLQRLASRTDSAETLIRSVLSIATPNSDAALRLIVDFLLRHSSVIGLSPLSLLH
jgi:hypothetical protein